MTIFIEGASVITIAVTVWFLGTAVNRHVPLLSRYNIPVSVTGGLLCSALTALLFYAAGVTVEFDLALRDLLLLVFFSTIGLSAKFRTLISGGKPLLLLVIAAFGLLILQNSTGVMMAYVFGAPPAYGLFAGSISLAGGYGTAIAWGQSSLTEGMQGAQELGIAFATFGLIAGGIMGGPIAEWLIRRHNLQGTGETAEGQDADRKQPIAGTAQASPSISSTLGMAMAIAICVQAGDLVNIFLSEKGLELPGFLTAMAVGIVITNSTDALNIRLNPVARQKTEEISLQLFLSMSLMSMQLWILAGAFSTILIVIFAQMAVISLFTVLIVFRLAGKDYDASVMAAGFAGLGMGATPVGIANMNAVTSKYGPSTKAFLIIPLVGAFFLDIANAFVIKTFLSFPFMQ
ncbi:sodium/glutamate symporter [Sneathiella marina]|uniref:Sodium/glutamate symporter n=1 Tax=Sneathiella marina TaxID=2950108 RepID=A0ABY4W7R0_9PROT|nr:sodium/glutamate symporter [Sneathiella marina]USG60686.1 sodium/glutamate symporter [Sneathiella marina]